MNICQCSTQQLERWELTSSYGSLPVPALPLHLTSHLRSESFSEWSVARKTYRREKNKSSDTFTSQLQCFVFLSHLGTWDLGMGEKLSLERRIKGLSVNSRGILYYCFKHSQITQIKFTSLRMWWHSNDWFQPSHNMVPESQNKFWREGKGEFMWIHKEHLNHFMLILKAVCHSDVRMRF